ncbi:Major facilitator superfamily domain-containing protein 8 [Durusdinium trenchii]|uniref:Major facilitator superfamily domain-containing protein 8 n=1 Tax=Durusdinium trenchii TaxID=1381693 RepID=A0ABP0LFV1_9DINO
MLRFTGGEKAPTPGWLLVFFSNMFFGCAGFSIVLPTLWPYLREMQSSTQFLAAVVAAYSVGEGLGGWISGLLYSRFPKHPKRLLQGGMLLGMLAAFSYAVARPFGSVAPYIVLLARFCSGFDNGTRQTIEQTFLASRIPPQHQTTCSSRLASCAITGIMMGPALGAPLQAIDFQLMGVTIDGNNGPGLVLFLVCIANFTVTSFFFSGKGQSYSTQTSSVSINLEDTPPPDPRGLLVCYMVFFGVNVNMASLETVTPVVAQRLYGWGPCLHPAECTFQVSQTYTNGLMSAGGFLSLTMAALMSFFGAHIYRREILVITVSYTVSAMINLGNMDFGGHLPVTRFVGDYLLGAFFGSLARGPGIALLSQVLGPHPSAGYMGVLFMVGALPRVLGPFLFVELLEIPEPMYLAHYRDVYQGLIPRTWLLYGCQAAFFMTVLVLLQTSRSHLAPHPTATGLRQPLLSTPETCVQIGLSPGTPCQVREGISGLKELSRRFGKSLSSLGEQSPQV